MSKYHIERRAFGKLRMAIVAAGKSVNDFDDDEMVEFYFNEKGFMPDGVTEVDEASFVEDPAPTYKEKPRVKDYTPLPAHQGDDLAHAITAAIAAAMASQHQAPAIDEAQIVDLINKHANKTITVNIPERKSLKTIDNTHEMFETVLGVLIAGLNPYLVGPAGSGKTTMGEQLADALGVNFYFSGKISEPFQLLGYKDAGGTYQETEFYKAFKHGGLFLKDELDASDDKAVTAFNAATANGYCDFPCGRVLKHEDCYIMAAGNTAGKGGNRTYLRNPLDGATMDRYAEIHIGYDERLERTIALSIHAEAGPHVDWVQSARAKAEEKSLPIIISPRASINGAKLLAQGFSQQAVKEMLVYKSESKDTIAAIR